MRNTEDWWIFTFGCGQKHGGYYVKIKGSYDQAREKMFKKYGKDWCFQYSLEEWQKYEAEEKAGTLRYKLEKQLEVIE